MAELCFIAPAGGPLLLSGPGLPPPAGGWALALGGGLFLDPDEAPGVVVPVPAGPAAAGDSARLRLRPRDLAFTPVEEQGDAEADWRGSAALRGAALGLCARLNGMRARLFGPGAPAGGLPAPVPPLPWAPPEGGGPRPAGGGPARRAWRRARATWHAAFARGLAAQRAAVAEARARAPAPRSEEAALWHAIGRIMARPRPAPLRYRLRLEGGRLALAAEAPLRLTRPLPVLVPRADLTGLEPQADRAALHDLVAAELIGTAHAALAELGALARRVEIALAEPADDSGAGPRARRRPGRLVEAGRLAAGPLPDDLALLAAGWAEGRRPCARAGVEDGPRLVLPAGGAAG